MMQSSNSSQHQEENSFSNINVVSYYMKQFDKSFIMSRHYHPYIELMYCHEGHFTFEALPKDEKDGKFKSFTVEKDNFIIVNSSTVHKICTPEECFIYNVEFSNQDDNSVKKINVDHIVSMNILELLRHNEFIYHKLVKEGFIILKNSQTVGHQLRTLISSLSKGINNVYEAVTFKARMLLLFNDIIKCTNENTSDKSITYVRKTKEYISQHYYEKISVDDIALYIGINKFYLQRFFKSMTGTTILTYINDYRLAKAKELLTTTSLSIEEVVTKSGFRNRQHLIYEFKNRFKITPYDYRKKYLNPIIDSSNENYISSDYDKEHLIK